MKLVNATGVCLTALVFDETQKKILFQENFCSGAQLDICVSGIHFLHEDIGFIGGSNEYMSKFKKYYPDYMRKFENFKKDWSEFNNITLYINNLEKFMK